MSLHFFRLVFIFGNKICDRNLLRQHSLFYPHLFTLHKWNGCLYIKVFLVRGH